MAYPVPGNGTTIAFGTLGTNATFTAHLLDVNGPEYTRPAIDMSNQSSPQGTALGDTDYNQTYREYKPGVCALGEVSVDIVYNPNHAPPVNEPNETITITYPKPFPAATANASFACDGFCSGFSHATPWEDKMSARMTLQMSGRATLVTAAEA
jgi:hypothetical protein